MMTPQKLQIERALLSSFFYDLLLIGPYLWVALQVGSLTMLGELIRGALLITVAIISFVTMRRIHREQTGGYDFGMGKLEQILSICVAVLLAFSMVFIWTKLINRSLGDTQQAQVTFISYLAIGLTFANLCANAAPIPPLYKAMKLGKSVLVATQFRAKITKSIGSVVVTLCVALNQLSSDVVLAFWAESVGVVIVTLVTLHTAYELIKSSLPDLLDQTLAEDLQVKINQVLARHYNNYEALKWCRSRQSGSNIEVYVGLGFAGDMAFAQVAKITEAVADDIETSIPRSRVIVTPVMAHRAGRD